ncbi:Hypothetical protein PBC10988_32320 [Planctomycetales bacterium 10988]|nr:Hypothetical protein PBC10988_32320 [Planctomycetales bacterium 10988]
MKFQLVFREDSLGTAAGLTVNRSGTHWASLEVGEVVVREAPVSNRRFRSHEIEETLAGLHPLYPDASQRIRPTVIYVREDPLVCVPSKQFQDTIDLEKRLVDILFRSESSYHRPSRIVCHHDSQRIAYLNGEDFVEVFSLIDGKCLAKLPCDPNPSNAFLAIHPDGEHCVGGTISGLVVWSISKQKAIHRLQEIVCPEGVIGRLRFSEDGKYLAVAGGLDPKQQATTVAVIETEPWKTLWQQVMPFSG